MNADSLIQTYRKHPKLIALLDALAVHNPSTQIALTNVQGSSLALLVAALYHQNKAKKQPYLLVLKTAEEAAYCCNTLENLINPLQVFYFPSSFKSDKNFSILNSSHVMLRTEALTSLAYKDGNPIVITYPEALFEKVVLAQSLTNTIIHIKINDSINRDQLIETLVGYGFEHAEMVYQPGQFALRGGILDIYSYGNEKPYRIELYGNEVETIRVFDPATQLSERKIAYVRIIPNIESQFGEKDKISLLDYLPADTLLWADDSSFIAQRLQLMEQALINYLSTSSATIAHTDPSETEEEQVQLTHTDFINASHWVAYLKTKKHIVFNETGRTATTAIRFDTEGQPSFNRAFPLLIQNLQQWVGKGYSLFIFAESPKQLVRLQAIFDDLSAKVLVEPVPFAIHEGFIDHDLKMVCYTDHQLFERYHKYRIKQTYNKSKAITLRTLTELRPGDYVTHIDHGVGTYSGLQKIDMNGKTQEAIRIIYKDGDILYVNIHSLYKITKYSGKEGSTPHINKIGSDAWQKLKEKTKTRVKEIAFDLIKLYAERKAQKGFEHSPDNFMQAELEASFVYEDTPDQRKASDDVKKDMENTSPMDRLVCGDVGFGKTEIAIRAAFKTCTDGKQAVILVPTTILAMQHFKTFTERLREFPVTIDYVNRFKSTKEIKTVYEQLANGKLNIVIGTHALLNKHIQFKNLGLIVIDEEQKFGVAAKEKLKTLRTNVDCLTLTATPIPRTLQFSLMGARDLSIINTPPPNRQPIQTELMGFNEDFIRDAIYFEAERGGQVFFIHNRIQGLSEMAALIQSLCPDLSIGYAHGQLEGHELEQKIVAFIEKKYDVLVCTNIVESGVDIPNTNTIIINNAHQYGLSDLHQLRGRVGRSNRKAFCYLLAPSLATLPSNSRKRLQTLEQHSDLGSGFQIAMRDLDIRGAGNILGGEQSGFMNEIGFDTYQKILNEAIQELKRSHFNELFKEAINQQDDFVKDCTIDTDLEILIPDHYVPSTSERLSLYTRLNAATTTETLQQFVAELNDRFGPIPESVHELIQTVRCRKLAAELGFEKIILKNNQLKFYFINKPDSAYYDSERFKNILTYIQTNPLNATLKQQGKIFYIALTHLHSIEAIHLFLQNMHQSVTAPTVSAQLVE